MRILASLAIVSAMLSPTLAIAQDAMEIVVDPIRSLKDIPQYSSTGVKYESWTIFVICNSRWSGNRNSINSLYRQFLRFGEAIGDSDVAIWPIGKNGEYSFSAGARFCRQLRLNPARGPHLITTTRWPGLTARPSSYLRVSFANAPPTVTEDLLEELTSQVILQDFEASKLNSVDDWSRMKSAAGQFYRYACPIISRVSVAINTPAIKVSYDKPSRRSESTCEN